MTKQRILVAGIPSSGKSTYLAATRHVLLSDETESRLVMTRLADEERHLNALQDRWLALKTFDRTRKTSEAWTTLHVRTRSTGAEAELIVPDLRGELFERPAATGQCVRPIAEALEQADGILLFTNAEKAHDERLISDYGDLDDRGDEGAEMQTDMPADPADDLSSGGEVQDARVAGRLRFRPDRMPEEAKIVELLQFANRRPRAPRRRRLGVIVSAWDAVLDGGDLRSPAQWIAEERPMLAQFVRHNDNAWEARFYGASAQGGQLPRDAAKLQALENASERVIMVGDGVPRHDPTAPIAWLINGD